MKVLMSKCFLLFPLVISLRPRRAPVARKLSSESKGRLSSLALREVTKMVFSAALHDPGMFLPVMSLSLYVAMVG